ncbi:Aste57867_13166 [Aphanomyces stellatus]|uniref:Aste57867_13166 protein n=1 Tax=Aphanomyces stellatus TaxID=120398 RepID=A0A485KXE7_9STRA|nr:hypothetical protein As57867_013117 [Aphanomyces stellatus]VFT90007.1 Aste57867_13166 [Aphanomyces stellatus]
MRRDGVVFSKLRNEHVATNRTVRRACRHQARDEAFIVEPRAASDATVALRRAAAVLSEARKGRETAVAQDPRHDLEVVGLYSVEDVEDMTDKYASELTSMNSCGDESKRQAADRLVRTFNQERQAMQGLGFGSRRHRDSLTKAEWQRINELASMSCPSYIATSWGDVASSISCPGFGVWYNLHRVDRASEIVPRLERLFRCCETWGWTKVRCKRRKGTTNALRWVRDVASDSAHEVNDDVDCVDESHESHWSRPRTGLTVFDFVESVVNNTDDSNEYDFCGVEPNQNTPSSLECRAM